MWGGGDRFARLGWERADERGRDLEGEEEQGPAPASAGELGVAAGTRGQLPGRGQVRGHRELSSQEVTQVASALTLAHCARGSPGGVSPRSARL